jgi:hypothetical protein
LLKDTLAEVEVARMVIDDMREMMAHCDYQGLSPSHNNSSLVLQDIIIFEILRRFRLQGSKCYLALAQSHSKMIFLIVNDISACIFDMVDAASAQFANINLCIKEILDPSKVSN